MDSGDFSFGWLLKVVLRSRNLSHGFSTAEYTLSVQICSLILFVAKSRTLWLLITRGNENLTKKPKIKFLVVIIRAGNDE